MSSTPTLTVAIPTYNGSRHLAEALSGILSQKGVAFDLLVCDDRSDDGTVDLVRSIAGSRARIVVNPQRLGLAGNWNCCVALSQSTLVNIFHQDDVMRPGHLAAHLEAFARSTKTAMVASAVEMVDDRGQRLPESIVEGGGLAASDRVFGPGELLPQLAVKNPLRCSAITLRADAHRTLGGFDASYRYVVDWEFWVRVARVYEVAWLSRPTVAMRWHATSETHRFKKGTTDLEETERLVESVADSVGDYDFRGLRVAANRRLARAYLNRSHDALRAGDTRLARRCLDRSFSLNPKIWTTIAADPRLALQLGLLVVSPGLAGSLLARKDARSMWSTTDKDPHA